MKVIAFYNQKGGVGKTASALAVSDILAEKYKKKVLIVDLDAQANTSLFFGKVKAGEYMQAMLLSLPISQEKIGLSIENLLLDASLDIHDVIQHTQYPGLDLIPSFLTLSACENRIQADITSPQQFRLKKHFSKIMDEYDYCILDCSPSISLVNINGLAMADWVYSPMKADAFSICGMATVKDLIESVSQYNPTLKFAGAFFTQWENKRITRTLLDFLQKNIPNYLLPIRIPKSKLIEEVTVAQKALYSYDRGYKSKETGEHLPSHVTQEYIKLTEDIMSR